MESLNTSTISETAHLKTEIITVREEFDRMEREISRTAYLQREVVFMRRETIKASRLDVWSEKMDMTRSTKQYRRHNPSLRDNCSRKKTRGRATIGGGSGRG